RSGPPRPLALLGTWAIVRRFCSAVRPAPIRGGVMSVIKFLVSRRAAGGLLVAVAAGIVAAAAFAGGSADAPGNGPDIAALVKSGSSFRGDVRALPQLPPQALARPEHPDREEPATRLD